MQTTIVATKKLNVILDFIAGANGVTAAEIKSALNISISSVHAAVQILLRHNCISIGAVQYLRKNNETGFKAGYFFEKFLSTN